MVITYAFLGIFIALMGYFAYFETVKSEDFINSPYNARQDSFSSSTVRGKIMGSGGEILAESNVDAEGKETRTYPYRNLFAHVVGYSTHGKLGVESAANFNLLRSNSFFLERIVNEIRGEKNKGDDVVTTLNVSLQQAAYPLCCTEQAGWKQRSGFLTCLLLCHHFGCAVCRKCGSR